MSINQQSKKSRKKYRSRQVCLDEASNLTNMLIGNLNPIKEIKTKQSKSIFSNLNYKIQKAEKQQKVQPKQAKNSQLDQMNQQKVVQSPKSILKTSEEVKFNNEQQLKNEKSEQKSQQNHKSNSSSINNDSSSDNSSNSQNSNSDNDIDSQSQSDNGSQSNSHQKKIQNIAQEPQNRSESKQPKLHSINSRKQKKQKMPKVTSVEQSQMISQQNNQINSKGGSEDGGEEQRLKRRRRNQTQMLLAHKIQILKSFLKDKPFIRKQQRAKPLVGLPRTMQQQWKRALTKYKKLRKTIIQQIEQRHQLYELICSLGEEQQQVINQHLKINPEASQFQSSSQSRHQTKINKNIDQKDKRIKNKNQGGQSDSSQSDEQNTIQSLCSARLKTLTRLKEAVYSHLQQLQSQPRFKSYMSEKQQKKQPTPKLSVAFIKKFSNWKKENQIKSKKDHSNLKQKLRTRKRVAAKYSLKRERSSSEQLSDESFQPASARQKIYLTRNSITRTGNNTNLLLRRQQKQPKKQEQYKIKEQQSLEQPPIFLKTGIRQKPVQPTSRLDDLKEKKIIINEQRKGQIKVNRIPQKYIAEVLVKKQLNTETIQQKLKQQKREKLSMQPRLIIESIHFRSSTQNPNNKQVPKKEPITNKKPQVHQETPKFYRKHIKQESDSSEDAFQEFKQFKKYQKMKKLKQTKRARKYEYVNTQSQSDISQEQTRQRSHKKHSSKHIKSHRQQKQPLVIYEKRQSGQKKSKHKHKLNDWQRKKRSREYSK